MSLSNQQQNTLSDNSHDVIYNDYFEYLLYLTLA